MAVTVGALLPLIAELGGEAVGAAAAMAPTALDRRNRERLQRLERLAAADALGLSEQQAQAIRGESRRATAAARRALEADRARLLSSAGGSGEALSQAIAKEQQEIESEQRLAERLSAADLQQAAEQEDELEALIAAQARRQVQRRASVADLSRAAAGEVSGLLGDLRVFGQGAEGPGSETDTFEQYQAGFEAAGISRAQAEELARFYEENPHLLEVQ
jgi:hypothetical protein